MGIVVKGKKDGVTHGMNATRSLSTDRGCPRPSIEPATFEAVSALPEGTRDQGLSFPSATFNELRRCVTDRRKFLSVAGLIR